MSAHLGSVVNKLSLQVQKWNFYNLTIAYCMYNMFKEAGKQATLKLVKFLKKGGESMVFFM